MKLVPYVDMINYPSLYSEPNDINGTKNSWEYYFEPYNHISGEEVYKDSFCISEEKYPYQWVLHYSTTNLFNEGFPTRKRVAKLNRYIMKYIKIHDELINEFQKDVDSLKITDCVGVHIRGTDMKNTKGHIKPMDVENVIDKLNGLADKHGISRIFLCTDEEYIKNRVFTAFEGKIEVCCLNAYRTTNHTQGLHWETTPNIVRENHKYQLGVEVLKDAYLLSKCKALVCGNSNVAYAAIVFNNNQYEWIACE